MSQSAESSSFGGAQSMDTSSQAGTWEAPPGDSTIYAYVDKTGAKGMKEENTEADGAQTSESTSWAGKSEVTALFEEGVTVCGIHPRLKLNEMQKKPVEFEFVKMEGIPHLRQYFMRCEVEGEEFVGAGRSKKLAAADAAEAALLKIYKIRYDPNLPVETKKSRKRRAASLADSSTDQPAEGGAEPKPGA
ncbi:double-stranded RNA-binding protein Staufen homolog 2, partial [Aplysia californica]|uniref:Double-stranded RNA-binding protein Staufen homolog 2 n=1 Tax=Aplysia californica TaxID=6500 RepID=A0ABM0K956_APLCA